MAEEMEQKSMDCIIELHKLELDAENYLKNRDLYNALNIQQKILQLKILLKNRVGQARTLLTMGKLYYEIGNYQKSREYHRYLIELLEESNGILIKKDFFKELYEFYSKIGDTNTANQLIERLNFIDKSN